MSVGSGQVGAEDGGHWAAGAGTMSRDQDNHDTASSTVANHENNLIVAKLPTIVTSTTLQPQPQEYVCQQ